MIGDDVVQTTRSTRITTADGRSIATTDLTGDNAIDTGFCAYCRRPRLFGKPGSGFVAEKPKRCRACGKSLCSHHSKKVHDHWYCPACAPWRRIGYFLLSLVGTWK